MQRQKPNSNRLIQKKINDYMATVHPDQTGWNSTLTSLKSFIFDFVEEDNRDIQIKIRYFEKSIESLRRRFTDNISAIQETHMDIWLGQCFERFGAWEKAVEAYQRAVERCEDMNQDNLKSEAIRSLGHIYLMRSEWKKAHESYKESLKLCEMLGDHGGEASAYNSIGILFFEKGKYEEASSNWECALELAEKIDDANLCAQITNNIGILKNSFGNWEIALTYYRKSCLLFERIGDDRGLAETYHNLGMTYADAGLYSESNSYYEKSLNIAHRIGDVRLQAMINLNRVELYTTINDVFAGLALCNKALQTFSQLEDRLGEAEVYKFLGILYGKQQEWDLSGSYFQDCIFLAEKHKNPLLKGEAYLEYGLMQKNKEDHESAHDLLEKARTIFVDLKAEKDIARVNAALLSISN
jgi:tetratricopeptide (TPR) repeat protein